MRRLSYEDYLNYLKDSDKIVTEDQVIPITPIKISRLEPILEEITDVSSTIWSFPTRGSWATHRGNYRGNWPPQIPRALMLMYTKPGDLVLDQMIGSGTTCIEARLLGRNCIGVDINYNAAILTLHRLYYLEEYAENRQKQDLTLSDLSEVQNTTVLNILNSWNMIYQGDARNLNKIENESIDLIATHPPYFNIIKYGERKIEEGDLSKTRKLEIYLLWMSRIAKESYRVLKPGKYCGILIGDTRIHKHYVPISHYVLQVFLEAGFILKEEVVKIQHKMKTTREVWNRTKGKDFLLIYHEKLFILRKPEKDEKITKYKYSRRMDLNNLIS